MLLDPRLESDSTFIIDLTLCHVRLSHNAAFPWIILIPKQDGLVELVDLTPGDQQKLMQEIALASQVMKTLFHPAKLNVGALGNIVSQLHVHVVARYETDGAWPGPVWNSGISAVYDAAAKSERISEVREAFERHPPYLSLSPLKQAYGFSFEAAQEGFDWDSPFQAVLKVQEEVEEVREELKKPDSLLRQAALQEELGDLFFACVSLARHCNVDPEAAAVEGLKKFARRYARLKSYAAEKGISLQKVSQEERINLWQQLKK
jgi:diadenosine tetraphosphate (Ap4A) HIT family hydrolase/NTP pyrophosphatase (non-canonical NTP hydrolase)